MRKLRSDSFLPTVKAVFKFFLPFLVCFFCLILLMVPLPIDAFTYAKPFLPFIPLFYFAVHLLPEQFSYGFAFLLGLFSDLLLAMPLGIMTLVCLLYYMICHMQKNFFYGKPFSVVFTGFTLLTFLAYFVLWLFISIYHARFFPFSLFFVSYLILICLYFPVSLICKKIASRYKQERSI